MDKATFSQHEGWEYEETEEEDDRIDHNKMIFLMDGDEEGYALVTTRLLDSAEIGGKFPVKKGGGGTLVRIPGREGFREFYYRAEWPENAEEVARAREEEKEEGGVVFGELCFEPRMHKREKSRSKTPTTRVVIGGMQGTPPSSSQGTETRTETRTETGGDGNETVTAPDETETVTKDERTTTNTDIPVDEGTDKRTTTDKDVEDGTRSSVPMGGDKDKGNMELEMVETTELDPAGIRTSLEATETVITPEIAAAVQVIMSEEEEKIPLIKRKIVGNRRRGVIEDEEEEGNPHDPKLQMKVCSTTEAETDGTDYKRKLRKRGMDCTTSEAEKKEEEKRKKKVKRKSKSRSPENAIEVPSSDEDSGRKTRDKGKTKEAKGKETKIKKEEENQEEEEIDLEIDTAIAGQEIGSMPTHTLGATAMEWVDEVEDCRRKSKRLQGAVSGQMRRKLEKTREAIAVLMLRAQAKGDQWFLQAENKEQHAQIAAMRKEIEELRKEVGDLRKQIKEEKKRKDRDRLEDLWDPDFPPLPQRPPIRGVSARIPSPRELSGERREEEVSRQVEALETMGKDIGRKQVAQDRSTKEGDTTEAEEDREKRERGKPRIISDIQLDPPLPLPRQTKRKQQGSEEWTEVRGRKDKLRKVAEGDKRREDMGQKKERVEARPQPRRPPPPPPRIRVAKPPKHAAVTITARKEGFSYADAMREARAKISLADLDITDTKVRRAINGGLLIEIEGEEGQAKADRLVIKLKEVLQESATVVSPRKYAEVRVIGLDDSVTGEELVHVLAIAGECEEEEVRTGPIRMARNGLGSAWARLPMGAAAKACVTGKIKIGWTVARIEVLMARPLQCHRCLHYGHVKYTCKSVTNREGACYNCGELGHQVRNCTAQSCCVVCKDMGRGHKHRLGGPMCGARTEQEQGRGQERRRAPQESGGFAGGVENRGEEVTRA